MPVLQNNPKFESSRTGVPTYTYDLRNRTFPEKAHIGHFSKNQPKMYQIEKSETTETATGFKMEFTIKSCQPVYPLGYVDGFGLYNAYFAMVFAMDPTGLRRTDQVQEGPYSNMENNQDIGWDIKTENESFKFIKYIRNSSCSSKSDLGNSRTAYYQRKIKQTATVNGGIDMMNDYVKAGSKAYKYVQTAKDYLDKANKYGVTQKELSKIVNSVTSLMNKAKEKAQKFSMVGHTWNVYERTREDEAIKIAVCICKNGKYGFQAKKRIIRRGTASEWAKVDTINDYKNGLKDFDRKMAQLAQDLRRIQGMLDRR